MRMASRRSTLVVALLTFGSLATGSPASADKDYRTQQISVHATDGASLTRGTVINTHADGPINYGIEHYHLVGAEPGSYTVVLNLGLFGCSQTDPFPTGAVLKTNAAGNAQGSAKFLTASVAPLVLVVESVKPDLVVYGYWTFIRSGQTVYATDCQEVQLDLP